MTIYYLFISRNVAFLLHTTFTTVNERQLSERTKAGIYTRKSCRPVMQPSDAFILLQPDELIILQQNSISQRKGFDISRQNALLACYLRER